MAGATIALEGDATLLPVLTELAGSIGARAVALPPGTKSAYHAAAATAAGGAVALLESIARIAAESGFDEKTALAVYLPLARQALANAESLGIAQSLTGPSSVATRERSPTTSRSCVGWRRRSCLYTSPSRAASWR